MIRAQYSLYKQRGATLLVSMLMLILIMILGITAMNSSTIQAMLSGNLQFADMAMNQSEAGLNAGENWLRSGTNAQNGGFAIYNSTNLPWIYPQPTKDPLTMVWDDTNSIQGANAQQRYYIEMLAKNTQLMGSGMSAGSSRKSTACNAVNLYQVTARGTAGRGATRYIQSIYSVLNC